MNEENAMATRATPNHGNSSAGVLVRYFRSKDRDKVMAFMFMILARVGPDAARHDAEWGANRVPHSLPTKIATTTDGHMFNKHKYETMVLV